MLNAEKITNQDRKSEVLVKLRDGSCENIVIIFIHPIGGTLFIYKPLITKLITEYPIYGIQDNFLDGQFKEHVTITEQASYYIKNIFEKLNPSTIILAGQSSGGTLAFEMSRQCIEYGVEVKKVFMFDTWIKAPFDAEFKDYFQKIVSRQIQKINPIYFSDEKFSQKRWSDFLWKRMSLLFSYAPTLVSVDVVNFIASDVVSEYNVDREIQYSWDKFVKSLTLIPVKGNHETLLDMEYTEDLASHINKLL